MKTKLQIFIKNTKCKLGKLIGQNKLVEIEELISSNMSAKNAKLIKDHIQELKDSNGEFSNGKMWQLKKKLFKRGRDPPSAKRDENGQLITSYNELLSLYLRTFQQRLRHRDINPELEDMLEMKNSLWSNILSLLKI